MKKLAKLLDILEADGGEISPFTKIFTLLFEKFIYFRIKIKKAHAIFY